jgi:hypothetical protein
MMVDVVGGCWSNRFSRVGNVGERVSKWSKWMDRSTIDVDIPNRMFDMLKVIHLRR